MRNMMQKRIDVLDALRGFSLLGVLLIHMQQHYGYFVSPELYGMQSTIEPSRFDFWVNWLTNNVMMGKFINIFAFLFGMSFFIQMDRAKSRGIDFRGRFCWRMILLLIIGIFSSMFYSGDILPIYALFGLILLLLYPFSNTALSGIVAFVLLGAPRMIMVVCENIMADNFDQSTISPILDVLHIERQDSLLPEKQTFLSVAKDNLTTGLIKKLNYQFGLVGRGYVTLALFILGLIIGRLRFFETLDQFKRRNLIVFCLFTALTIGLTFIIRLLPQPPFWTLMKSSEMTFLMMLCLALSDIRMVLYSASISMGFILLYQAVWMRSLLDILSPYGRMGLTNFVIQGVIGAIMFAPWGFQQVFCTMGAFKLFLIGIGVYMGQLCFSYFWLRAFRYGPLEWLWRSATYMKAQPFIK